MARVSEEQIHQIFKLIAKMGFRVTIVKYGGKYSVTLWRKNPFVEGFSEWLSFEGNAKQVETLAKAMLMAYNLGQDEISAYYMEILSKQSEGDRDASNEQKTS
jgi:hypothetical protein